MCLEGAHLAGFLIEKKRCIVTGRLSGMVPPILLLLSSMVIIDVKFASVLPSCPPKLIPLRVMAVIFDAAHPTPCQFSTQGSPPFVTHPGKDGDPSAVYKPFIANTSCS